MTTQNELVDKIFTNGDTGLSKKDIASVVKSVIGGITEELAAGNDVRLTDLGTFHVKELAERTGRNPKTGAAITIPASKAAKFKPSTTLKNMLN